MQSNEVMHETWSACDSLMTGKWQVYKRTLLQARIEFLRFSYRFHSNIVNIGLSRQQRDWSSSLHKPIVTVWLLLSQGASDAVGLLRT